MRKLNILSAFDHLFHSLVGLIVTIIYLHHLKHFLLLGLVIIYFILLFIKSKKICLMTILLVMIYYLNYQIQYQLIAKDDFGSVISCRVKTIPVVKHNKLTFYCHNKKGTIYVSYKTEDYVELKLGDQVTLEGNAVLPHANSVPFQFDFKQYLYSKNVYYILYVEQLSINNRTTLLNEMVINKILDRYDQSLSHYQLALLIGYKANFDDEVEQSYSEMNLSHLLVVSGFHVGVIYLFLYFVLTRLGVTEETTQIFILITLILYLILNAFQTSILRAVCFFTLIYIKKRWSLNISNIQLLSFICLVNLLVQPLIIYHTGFILSYLITLILLLSTKIITSKHYLIKLYQTSFVAQLFSLPIIANFSFFYHALSILFSPVFMLLYTFLIFPLTFLSLLHHKIESLLLPLFALYEHLLLRVAEFDWLIFNVGAFDLNRSLFYYIILFMILIRLEKRRSYWFLSIILVVNILFYHKLVIVDSITYLDVGQGDSSLIHLPTKQCTALIDTGGTINQNTSYRPGQNVLHYLQARQIKQLDYLILSHSHEDHAGDYDIILSQIEVNYLVFSSFDRSDLRQSIIDYSIQHDIPVIEVSQGTTLPCGKQPLSVVSPQQDYDNLNDNSIVIFFKLNHKNFLFTGDITSKVEEELIKDYDFKIDYLKVAHHGSKTATTDDFISHYQVDTAIISVGTNYYRHPSDEVLERLNNQQVRYYTTQKHGTIIIKFFFRKSVIFHELNSYNNIVPLVAF